MKNKTKLVGKRGDEEQAKDKDLCQVILSAQKKEAKSNLLKWTWQEEKDTQSS